ALSADEYRLDDQRSLIRVSLDHDQLIDDLRALFDGGGKLETEILATRGRSLILARSTLRVPDPEAAATALMVSRVDADGRHTTGTTFDPENVDAAFTELDRMYLETEGAEYRDVLLLVSSFLDGLRARDTARASLALDPDVVVREHGAISAPDLAPDE